MHLNLYTVVITQNSSKIKHRRFLKMNLQLSKHLQNFNHLKSKGKGIPVKGRGGP
jgi:hypothetical protein